MAKKPRMVVAFTAISLLACRAGEPSDSEQVAGTSGGGGVAGEGVEGGVGGAADNGGAGGQTPSKGGMAGSDGGGAGGEAPVAGGAGGGGAAGSGGVPPAGKFSWCDDPKARIAATDGTHTSADVAKSLEAGEPARQGAPKGMQGLLNPPGSEGANWKDIYVPAGYDAAKPGEVALWVGIGVPGTVTAVRVQLDYLIHRGEIPPVILLDTNFDGDPNRIVNALLPEVLGKFPKISSDPGMRVISGGSTRGAEAFDLAWDRPDLFGLVFTGSGSFVCFRKNWPYGFTLQSSAQKKNIRTSMAVGTCDIWGLPERWPADCGTNCGAPLCIDASNCRANWLDANKEMAAGLAANGYPHQLLIVAKGRHNAGTYIANFGDQVRWLFKPQTCK